MTQEIPERPLDDVDRILVRELARDGRATLSYLAARAGLSVSAVQTRVRRLESRGVLTGYAARVNPESVGQLLSAFVAITPLDLSRPDEAPALLGQIDGVEACYSVAGEESYVLLVRVPSPRALEELLQRIRITANVRTRSTVILQTFYEGRQFIPHRQCNLLREEVTVVAGTEPHNIASENRRTASSAAFSASPAPG